ncbi:uncharacterized protein MKK02DRAFT_40879 [Dioszegia hungarica]|uniref:Uncharacterized protein n=1 Tax=Dioszegia hungarica TaxID=4972 RepID=A0AA38H1Y9_9TREE|nr:uncharacterized protein MKK02DRAFT_40879 [Dioszegia hungarica]KAI9632575.1 hypothetical protein MKK02DRAFT_40879 [Dioszegia hungarica]
MMLSNKNDDYSPPPPPSRATTYPLASPTTAPEIDDFWLSIGLDRLAAMNPASKTTVEAVESGQTGLIKLGEAFDTLLVRSTKYSWLRFQHEKKAAAKHIKTLTSAIEDFSNSISEWGSKMYPLSKDAEDNFTSFNAFAKNMVKWSGNAFIEGDKRDEQVELCRTSAVTTVGIVLDQMRRVSRLHGPSWGSLIDVESAITGSARAIAWLGMLEVVLEQAGCKTWKEAKTRIDYWCSVSTLPEFGSKERRRV